MSRRYAASERVRTWSDEYMCTVSIIPGRELVYHYEPRPKKRYTLQRTLDHVKDAASFLREHGEATVAEICDALDMSKSSVRNLLDKNKQTFQVRVGRQKQGPVNLWSLRR